MEEIDPHEYQKTLELLLEKKMAQFGESTLQIRKKKTIDYLMRQGFEYNSINDAFVKLLP
jgi:SOS response regulatory protein OraA/RecX